MTDDEIKRLRDEAIRETVSELLDGGREDLANLITALWYDVDRLIRQRDEARAEVERLRKAQGVWDGLDAQTGRHPQGPVVALVDQAERAEKVVEAARPFAGWASDQIVNRLPIAVAQAGSTPVLGNEWAEEPEVTVSDLDDLVAALAAYDATKDPAEPANTSQADIVGDGADEGGSAHRRASCADCGRQYGDRHGFPDLVIADAAWRAISPDGEGNGLLCPSCICKRLHDAGLVTVPHAFKSGPLCGHGAAERLADQHIGRLCDQLQQASRVGDRSAGKPRLGLYRNDKAED